MTTFLKVVIARIEVSGRDDRIRTCGLFVPNEARYQAALHPDHYPSYQTEGIFLTSDCFQHRAKGGRTQLLINGCIACMSPYWNVYSKSWCSFLETSAWRLSSLQLILRKAFCPRSSVIGVMTAFSHFRPKLWMRF